MKKVGLITFLVIAWYGGLPQSSLPEEKADSLWTIWEDKTVEDTTRLNALYAFAWDGYLYSQSDSAIYYGQIMYDYARSRHLQGFMASALSMRAIALYFQGQFEESIELQQQTLEIEKQLNNASGIAYSLLRIGLIYDTQGRYSEAVNHYLQALKIFEREDIVAGIANCYNNIGAVYHAQGESEKALTFYSKNIELKRETGDIRGTAGPLVNIGLIYHEKKEWEEALRHYFQAYDLYEEGGDDVGVAAALNNIGEAYRDLGSRDSALYYLNEGLERYRSIGNHLGMATSLNNIGHIYGELGQYTKAIDYSTRAMELAQETGSIKEIKDAAQRLYQSYEKAGRYKDALEMHVLFAELHDSILSEESKYEVVHQEYKYEYEKQAAADSVAFLKEQKIREIEIKRQKAEIRANRNQKYALYGGLIVIALFAGLMANRFRVTKKKNQLIDEARKQVEEKNKEITDSILYARRIQSAILPPKKVVKSYLPDSFIYYQPKDIVAGDFYWMEYKANKVFFAACDCTGHGVPGAMVSVVCNNGLNRAVREHGLHEPGQILDKAREIVLEEFEKSEEDVNDGMDIALCTLEGNTLQYAGANNPLWIVRGNEVLETRADKQPIGKFSHSEPYTTHTIDLKEGDTIYIFSDGYIDQFGGKKGKKFKTAAFRELLLSIRNESMDQQRKIIEQTFEDWRGSLEQIDDVCVIGVRFGCYK